MQSLPTRPPKSSFPKTLPGFEHVNRFWDNNNQRFAAKIMPGEFYVSTRDDEVVATVLGSCISACIRDPITKVGGMNHFMLPATEEENFFGAATRFGQWAMEYLINEILKQGGRRERLEVKIFGGGQVLANMTDIGRKNINFAKDFLAREGLNIISEDVGDIYPRKVVYFPDSGRVRLKRLQATHNNTLEKREREYLRSLQKKTAETGDVELF